MSKLFIKRNTMGHAEIVRGSEVGLIFDKALNIGTYSKPTPTNFMTTVYRQRQRRITGSRFWDRETDFTENTAAEAENKAKNYLQKQKWQYIPYEG